MIRGRLAILKRAKTPLGSPKYRLFSKKTTLSVYLPSRTGPVAVLQPPIPPPHKRPITPRKRKTKRDTVDLTAKESVLVMEIAHFLLLQSPPLNLDDIKVPDELVGEYLYSSSRPQVVLEDVQIAYHTSEGEGLALIPLLRYSSGHNNAKKVVLKVPKTVPGDVVLVKLMMHHNYYIETEKMALLNAKSRLSRRNDRLVVCGHFEECSGCHLQMLGYEDQLRFKQGIIRKAYRFFYPSLAEQIASDANFGSVTALPMQYAYRGKLTPHFAFDARSRLAKEPVSIGFNHISPKAKIVDVENCAIATPSINRALPKLRESTFEAVEKNAGLSDPKRRDKLSPTLTMRNSLRIDHNSGEYEEVCLTQSKNVITERVEECVFQFEANEFFQPNSFILPQVLDFIRYSIKRSGLSFKYIVDTYCGVGFFGILLAQEVPENGKVFGIEISRQAISYANHNAKINGLLLEKVEFIEGDSETLFTNEKFETSGIVGEESVVIMDPSRKGSTRLFIKQLLHFRPQLIIYVSCNVFTQARDLSTFYEFQKSSDVEYKVLDVRGFDFFPQTKHVESVAILKRVK